VKAFCRERFKPFETEREAETKRSENKEKVRELGAAIKKRLNALPPIPAPTAAPTDNAVPSTPSTLSP
jgi:hypothetical protein